MDIPFVSICVPTFNSSLYLRQCLDSIAMQTYDSFEVVISDNASTDDTATILREYAERYRYRIHFNKSNAGAGANFNNLIRLARGEYIAIYHADDVYESSIVKESADVLSTNPSIGLVGTMGTVIDRNNNRVEDIEIHEDVKKLRKLVFGFDEAMLGAIRNVFVTPSIMVRKKAYTGLGMFDQSKYKSAQDYEMWLRIATKYNVAIIDKKLIKYRIHENQGSEREVRKNIEIPDILSVLMEYRRFLSDAKVIDYCEAILDKWLFKAAKKQNYCGYYEKSIETLRLLANRKYWLPKYLFMALNRMRVSPKKRAI